MKVLAASDLLHCCRADHDQELEKRGKAYVFSSEIALRMSMLKEVVARGIYYNSIGMKDYELWAKTIVHDYGSDIKQYIRDIRKWSLILPLTDSYGKIKKINCWEFMGCDYQANVEQTKEEKVCPALKNGHLNGIHGGKNAGRACWVVPYTHCFGTTQGTCEQKYSSCQICDFYRTVVEEEEEFFNVQTLKSML